MRRNLNKMKEQAMPDCGSRTISRQHFRSRDYPRSSSKDSCEETVVKREAKGEEVETEGR